MFRVFPHARVLAGAVIASLVLALAMPASYASADPGNGKLAKKDRELVATAIANGGSSVTLLIAAKDGQSSAVSSSLAALGGTIRYQDSALGYIRVDISAAQADKVAALPGVEAVEVDQIIPLEPPIIDVEGSDTEVSPPGPTTPPQNAYMPTRDIGAPQFVAAHPTYDGRGVKIGILDTGIDLFTPQLQTAKALDGTATRKIVEWVTYTDPVTDNDPTWVDMSGQVTATAGTFVAGGVTYTVAVNGTYRFGLFNERDPRLGGELGNDVNRDGNPAGSSGLFGVLWDTASNTVWVDTDQDRNFSNQAGMTDYRTNYDIGTFGTDRAATPQRDTVPFVVQTDGKNKFVNIGIVSGAHGTHVAGIAAGKGFFGGAYNGAAPEAQIVSVRVCLFISGCTAHALVEGMIFAAKQANVDVINMSIGGLPALNDGNNTRAILYNRLIDQSGAQMFISAGNSGPGVNTVGDPSVATRVMSIGAYVHKDTWLNNYGAVAAKTDGMFVFSSRGPREDGGFKPNIVAPGSAISSIPAWQSQAGQCVAGTYTCPVGYAMFNGTSMAAPQATGGAALLISASKQAGAQYKPDQLRQAINSSARYLPAYGAHEQGNGLFNVGAAWDLLKTNIKTVGIASKAPVKTVLSGFLATPNYGPGIYEREGWAAGQTGSRTITLTRTTGGSKPITYNLTWVGNDGTFASAASISLGHNTPAALTVNVTASTAGAHSALLYVDDPATVGIDYQIMNTVIAAGQFTAPSYSVSYSGSADRPDKATFFFNVPANTPAFKVDLTGVTGRVRLLRFHPYGLPIDNATAGYQTGGTQSRTLSNPAAGVWEVTVDTSRTSAVSPATFTLTGSILGASVSPDPDVIASATIGVPVARSYTLTNLYGAFTGRAVGTALGSARRGTFTIANLAVQEYPITVTVGSTSLRATIGGTSDPGADLDLFVYNCTAGPCVLAGQSADGDSEESVTIANPAAGSWKVVVDGFAVPAGTTTYKYIDVFTNAAFGAVSVTDANALRPAGSSWTVPASVTANAAPAADRVLYGNVQVRTDTNITVGSGDVIVESVSP